MDLPIGPSNHGEFRRLTPLATARSRATDEVFTYDQRIPTSLWDHHTVLCRGLTVLVLLPEPFRDREERVER